MLCLWEAIPGPRPAVKPVQGGSPAGHRMIEAGNSLEYTSKTRYNESEGTNDLFFIEGFCY